MKNIKAMIVDDSNFSIKVIKGLLEKHNIDVLCQATTVEDAIQVFKDNKESIDLVTMDVTLPDGSGIDCVRELIYEKNDVNVIVISSMMDDELVTNAKHAGAKSCIQKPVDEEELMSKISRMFEGETIYELLTNEYENAFIESTESYLTRLTEETVTHSRYDKLDKIIPSKGISIALGLIGTHRGRFILDISKETALELAKKAYKIDDITEDDMTEYILEASNIIAGNAASLLNGLYRSLGLRVSPPTIFSGEDLGIFIGDIDSSSLKFVTKFGNIFINVGFQRGKTEWM